MSSHEFHEICLPHLNGHVKENRPVLTAALEPVVHDFIIRRIAR